MLENGTRYSDWSHGSIWKVKHVLGCAPVTTTGTKRRTSQIPAFEAQGCMYSPGTRREKCREPFYNCMPHLKQNCKEDEFLPKFAHLESRTMGHQDGTRLLAGLKLPVQEICGVCLLVPVL